MKKGVEIRPDHKVVIDMLLSMKEAIDSMNSHNAMRVLSLQAYDSLVESFTQQIAKDIVKDYIFGKKQ